MRIYALKNGSLNEAERLELGRLLLKAGYMVKMSKEKEGGKGSYKYLVEFWEEREIDNA